jgi:site-specific recombinase XerD
MAVNHEAGGSTPPVGVCLKGLPLTNLINTGRLKVIGFELRSKKMNKTTSTIHRYDNQYVNFKRRLEGTKTYLTVKQEQKKEPKTKENPYPTVLNKKEIKLLRNYLKYLRVYESELHGDLRKRMLVDRLYLVRKNGVTVELDKINNKTIDTVIENFSDMTNKLETINGWKNALRKFLYWRAYGNTTIEDIHIKGYPKVAKKIRIHRGRPSEKKTFAYEDCLTRNECLKLIQGATSIRDKAFISMLVETGARVSELGNLKIKDLKFEEGNTPCYLLKLRGKTGERTNSIEIYFKYLNEWLSTHPNKDKDNFNDSYLWVNWRHQIGEHSTYTTLKKVIRHAKKKAGLTKKVYPHLFRHTWITHKDEEGWNSQEIGDWVGWTKNTDMSIQSDIQGDIKF